MDWAKIAPIGIGVLVLVVFLASRQGGAGGRYNVVSVGGDYSDRVAAAGVYRDLTLGLEAAQTERLRIETEGSVATESLNVARELGRLQVASADRQYREAQATRRLEIETAGAGERARADAQAASAQAQRDSNIVTGFLSFVGTLVGSLVGLSGDVGYYAQLREATGSAKHAGTQWALVRRGLP